MFIFFLLRVNILAWYAVTKVVQRLHHFHLMLRVGTIASEIMFCDKLEAGCKDETVHYYYNLANILMQIYIRVCVPTKVMRVIMAFLQRL